MSKLTRGVALALGVVLVGAPAHAVDYLQAGLKLVMKANPTANKFKTVWVSKLPAPVLPGASPIDIGGTFQILNLNGSCESAVFSMPAGAANWKTNAGGTLYKFVNKLAPAGPSPVKVAIIKSGAVLKVVAKSTGITLNEATQGKIGVALKVGGDRYCSVFGSPTKDEPNKFISKNQPAPASCWDGVCCSCGQQLKFQSGIQGGNCGDGVDSTGASALPLLCQALYIGGGQSTLNDELQGDYITNILNVTCTNGTGFNLTATTSAETGNNNTCTEAGCNYTAPLPLQNPLAPLNTCIINTVGPTDAIGSGDCTTGDVAYDLPLLSTVRLTGGSGDLLVNKRCQGGSNPGIACPLGTECLGGGTCADSCVGGANANLACATHADCPGAGAYCTTGPQPCPVCVSGVCHGGANDGGACFAFGTNFNQLYPTSADCQPAGIALGTLVIPYALTTGTSQRTSTDGNICKFCRDPGNLGFGVCSGGTRAGLSCLQTGNNATTGCPPSASGHVCQNPVPCTSNGDCAADPAGRTVCEQKDEGAFGDTNVTTITETGSPTGNLADFLGHSATLVSAFCIPPLFNGSIDTTANLPGPGAVALPGTIMVQNTTTTIATTTTTTTVTTTTVTTTSSTTTTTLGGSPSGAFVD